MRIGTPVLHGRAAGGAARWRSTPRATSTCAAPSGSGPARTRSDEAAVEVAFVDDLIGMRNSADPDGPVLVFTQAEWDAFVAGAQDGEFDLS